MFILPQSLLFRNLQKEFHRVEKKIRDSNFELLRLFLILFVIILHYNGEVCNVLELTQNASFGIKYFIRIGEALCVCAVNVFLLISGYFLCEKETVNIRKIINLFVVLIVFSFAAYFFRLIFHIDEFKIKALIGCLLPSNYYAYLYSAVFILSPFLNLITRLEKKRFNLFLLIILILFSIIPTALDFLSGINPSISSSGRSFISGDGNNNGYTLINFILLYYVGSFIKKNEIKIQSIKSILAYIASTFIILIGMKINPLHKFDYCNIFVICQAFFFFMLFTNISIKSQIINFMAKSVWGMFIIHFSVMKCICKFIDIENVCSSDSYKVFIVTFLVIILSFIISMIIDIILRLLIKPVNYLIDKIKYLNISITTKEETDDIKSSV